MPSFDRTPNATGLTTILIALLVAPAVALAHASSFSGTHTSQVGTIPRAAPEHALLAPHTPTHQDNPHPVGTTEPGVGTTQGGTGLVAPPPNFSAQCEGEVSANCEARAESDYTASNGDPNPVWSVPTPTAVPSTPPAPQINEPPAGTQDFEQSGGGSGVTVAEGGGPTLADCMALWEPAVHMTKQLWKNVCVRTMNGIDEPQVALGSVDPGYARSKRTSRQARN